MPSSESRSAMAPPGVDFINENNRRRGFFHHLKKISHSGRPHADKHLDEFRTREMEEGHACLSRHRPRQKSFAGPGRSHQENAPRDARADVKKLLGASQKINDFNQLLLGFFGAGHILEEHALLQVVGLDYASARLAEGKSLHPALL